MYQITIGGEGETAQTDNAEYFLNSYRRMSIRIIIIIIKFERNIINIKKTINLKNYYYYYHHH